MKTPKKVLIVDDNPEILNVVSLILKGEGYLVEQKEDGHFIDTFAESENLPDLILLDVLLSGRDGRELCRTLKNNPKTAAIPVIMFSAYPNTEKTALEAGASAFLQKPFALKELTSTVNKLLKK